MNVLSKMVSFLAVFCIFDAANAALRAGGASGAATARVSVATTPGAVASAAARRIPTMTMTATAQDTTGGAALASTTECVESYSECIKGNDACGSDFEECTTRELFYAQMPKCNSVLMQCSSAGVNALFGTTSMSSLTIENIDSLPKPGSIIDQYITAGEIMNRLDTGQCVQRYLRCLHGDSVCGEEFELCTTNAEFKKQKVFCESTLARCQDEGKKELFGSVDTTQYPVADSRLATMIAEGLEMAAVNAVQTCFKVADACILNACRDNPLRCIADTNLYLKDLGDVISTGNTSVPPKSDDASTTITQREVKAHMRNACFETIGANPSCHMTAGDNKGKMPKASDLRDEYKRDEVFTAVYDLRKNAVAEKLAQLRDEFDKEARDKCAKTITDCIDRTCGDGVGPACYASAFKTSDEPTSVNNPSTRKYIKAGCELIVNTDPNCQYAAVSSDDILKAFAYNYNGNGAFDTLFPERTSASDTNDPINVVAAYNASLQEKYNDNTLANTAKLCKRTVESCVKSMCGSDYSKCYRNRSDIMSDTYSVSSAQGTDHDKFDNNWNKKFVDSMNKVSGVLDFTIIRGLCIDNVKQSASCEQHLQIQAYKNQKDPNNGWGGNITEDTTVVSTWGSTAKGYTSTSVKYLDEMIETGYCTADVDNTNCKNVVSSTHYECGWVDENGCSYTTVETERRRDYILNLATDTLFRQVLDDLEKNAQAQYNAKLTEEQNMCRNANSGGLIGRNNMTGTYRWVKLKSSKLPKSYASAGLTDKQIANSNDIYGSFCAARVTIQSDDPYIQEQIRNGSDWSTRYFAVGDVFTCGSWIPQDHLESIASSIAQKQMNAQGKTQYGLTTSQKWWLAGATILSAGAGGWGMDALQTGTNFGKLLGTNDRDSTFSEGNVNEAKKNLDDSQTTYIKVCGGNLSNDQLVCKSAIKTMDSFNMYNWEEKKGSGCTGSAEAASCTNLHTYITDLRSALNIDSKGKTKDGRKGRAVLDTVAAAGTGIAGFLATRETMKDTNKKEYDEETRAIISEFMSNVGSHIYCFIGAEEAGTFGDVVEVSME